MPKASSAPPFWLFSWPYYATVMVNGVSLTKLRVQFLQPTGLMAFTVAPCEIVIAVGAVAENTGTVKFCEIRSTFASHPHVPHGL